MGLGSLATIGIQRPANLAVIVFDNGVYGETGMQPSHTQSGVDLVAVARRLRFRRHASMCATRQGLRDLAARLKTFTRDLFARVPIAPKSRRACCRCATGIELKQRFRAALGVGP